MNFQKITLFILCVSMASQSHAMMSYAQKNELARKFLNSVSNNPNIAAHIGAGIALGSFAGWSLAKYLISPWLQKRRDNERLKNWNERQERIKDLPEYVRLYKRFDDPNYDQVKLTLIAKNNTDQILKIKSKDSNNQEIILNPGEQKEIHEGLHGITLDEFPQDYLKRHFFEVSNTQKKLGDIKIERKYNEEKFTTEAFIQIPVIRMESFNNQRPVLVHACDVKRDEGWGYRHSSYKPETKNEVPCKFIDSYTVTVNLAGGNKLEDSTIRLEGKIDREYETGDLLAMAVAKMANGTQ